MRYSVGQLVDIIHTRLKSELSRVSDVEPGKALVYFNFGVRRYMVTEFLSVLEVADGKCGWSIHSSHVQHLLHGGKRDDDGNQLPLA